MMDALELAVYLYLGMTAAWLVALAALCWRCRR
jgi:hypothetical protein